jgi:hypothetical protein
MLVRCAVNGHGQHTLDQICAGYATYAQIYTGVTDTDIEGHEINYPTNDPTQDHPTKIPHTPHAPHKKTKHAGPDPTHFPTESQPT